MGAMLFDRIRCAMAWGAMVIILSVRTWADDPAPSEIRRPVDAAEERYWLANMRQHGFTDAEIALVTGFRVGEVEGAKQRAADKILPSPVDGALRVLPYPGGRHPRIGFLEGAIRPQRETKVSVFAPWDEGGYAVADVPEAIWSNLGLTYLAHTHVPTVWSKQGIELAALEWNRRADGSYDISRRLPNGIAFATVVRPAADAVRMQMTLTNGTPERLVDLRVQNCVMLARLRGFEAQTNDNKLFRAPYCAARSADGTHWIITAWWPCQRAWGNAPCPCLHSDPQFPDCDPGATVTVRGWLSFYVGTDVDAELDRIDQIDWKHADVPRTVDEPATSE